MRRLGLEVKTLEGDENPFPNQLESLTLLQSREAPVEPTVRLYRGVETRAGESLAHQASYILKKPVYEEGSLGFVKHAELESLEAFEAVDAFIANPSYERMIAMVNSTDMSDLDRRFVARRIYDIQLSLLRYPNRTLMDELRFNHVAAPGGSASQDLSPFVATSLSAEKAAAYGNNLMVLDVPQSQLGDCGESDEVLVVKSIKPEWITAVAHFKTGYEKVTDAQIRHIALQLGGAEAETRTEDAVREMSELRKKSADNHDQDIAAINRIRIDNLLMDTDGDDEVLRKKFDYAGITDYKDALWLSVEYYTKLQAELMGRQTQDVRKMFDYDEIDEFQFVEIGELQPRILDAAAVHQLARRHHRQYERFNAVAS